MADNKNASVANSKTKLHVAPKVRKRLNLDLSEEAYTLLQELAEAEDKNMAEVLRTGLALYGIAHEERLRGRSLGVVQDDRVIKEIVITK